MPAAKETLSLSRSVAWMSFFLLIPIFTSVLWIADTINSTPVRAIVAKARPASRRYRLRLERVLTRESEPTTDRCFAYVE